MKKYKYILLESLIIVSSFTNLFSCSRGGMRVYPLNETYYSKDKKRSWSLYNNKEEQYFKCVYQTEDETDVRGFYFIYTESGNWIESKNDENVYYYTKEENGKTIKNTSETHFNFWNINGNTIAFNGNNEYVVKGSYVIYASYKELEGFMVESILSGKYSISTLGRTWIEG